MRKLSACLIVCILLGSIHLGWTQAPPEGFVSLIDATSMKGWRGASGDWQVQDGVMIGRTDGTLKANRFIVADIEPVKNF
ncbi:MAG: hypothetical protein MI861_03330, partial [Pirellulales bacterium]|nr:hypothetical protein [Pirellulales bacterium]